MATRSKSDASNLIFSLSPVWSKSGSLNGCTATSDLSDVASAVKHPYPNVAETGKLGMSSWPAATEERMIF